MQLPPPNEDFVRIKGAHVLWRDVSLANLAGVDVLEAALDDLLLDEVGCMSQPHVQPNDVNAPPQADGETIAGFRPDDYGRAALFATRFGPLDVKGIGVKHGLSPKRSFYETGLMTLEEAITEACTERHIGRLLRLSGDAGYGTVRTLAVIALPFQRASMLDEGAKPSALLVREAYPRIRFNSKKEAQSRNMMLSAFDLELRLRRFGITSTFAQNAIRLSQTGGQIVATKNGAPCSNSVTEILGQFCQTNALSPPQKFDVSNVQFAMDPSSGRLMMVDFGWFMHRKRFSAHLVVAYGGDDAIFMDVLSNKNPAFVRKSQHTHRGSSHFRTLDKAGRDHEDIRLIVKKVVPLCDAYEQTSDAAAISAFISGF